MYQFFLISIENIYKIFLTQVSPVSEDTANKHFVLPNCKRLVN